MNPVCTFIDLIKDITDEEYNFVINLSSSEYFVNGGCYELVKILKYFLEDSEIWVRNDFEHCVIKYKGILYDINGIIEDETLYHKATKEDMDFLNDEWSFGRIEVKFDGKKPADTLIHYILDCGVGVQNIIEACRSMTEVPNFYIQKQKQIKR